MNWKFWGSVTAFLTIFSLVFTFLYPDFMGISTMLIVILSVLTLLFLYERECMRGKEIALIAMLGAFSAAARVPFAALPNIQPCTFIILITGYVFGPFGGFLVGAETALLSNFFLGQGPWTPWQMIAWGLIGMVGWAFRKAFGGRKLEMEMFMLVGFLSGYLYGIIMNLWYWLAFIYPHTLESFLMVEATSVWFDTLHGLGNVVFIDLFANRFIKILQRYKVRFGLFSKTQATFLS